MRVLLAGPFPRNIDAPRGGVAAACGNLAVGLSGLPEVNLSVVANEDRAVNRPSDTEIRQLMELPGSARQGISTTFVPCRGGLSGWLKDIHGTVLREIKRQEVDVVHVQGISSLAARLPQSLLTVHGIAEGDAWSAGRSVKRYISAAAMFALEGIPRRRARRVISISPYTLAHLGRSSTGRVWEIPNAIHPAFFESDVCTSDREKGLIVYAGVVAPRKNVLGLINSFEIARNEHPQAHLLIVGHGHDSEYGQRCKELIDRRGLRGSVTVSGPVIAPDLAAQLRSAAVLALSSMHENAPMVIAEALASGTPVVSTRVGAAEGMISGLPGCRTVQPGDEGAYAHELSAALEFFATQPRSVLRARACKYSPRRIAQQTLRVYQEIAKREDLPTPSDRTSS